MKTLPTMPSREALRDLVRIRVEAEQRIATRSRRCCWSCAAP